MKTYVVGTHLKRLAQVLLMSTHNICFRREIRNHSANHISTFGLKKASYQELRVLMAAYIVLDKVGYFFIFLFFLQMKSIDIFLISPQKHMLRYSLEVPHRSTSNEYQHHMFLWRNKKNIYLILSNI